jgi:hypothetical protein
MKRLLNMLNGTLLTLKTKYMKATIRSLEKIGLEEFVSRFDKVEKVSRRKHHWLHLIKTDNLICPASGKSVSQIARNTVFCKYD